MKTHGKFTVIACLAASVACASEDSGSRPNIDVAQSGIGGCSSDGHCLSGSFCNLNTGACKPQKVVGATCNRDAMCITNYCRAGICSEPETAKAEYECVAYDGINDHVLEAEASCDGEFSWDIHGCGDSIHPDFFLECGEDDCLIETDCSQ